MRVSGWPWPAFPDVVCLLADMALPGRAPVSCFGLIDAHDMAQYRRFGAMIRERFSNPIGTTQGEGDMVELRFRDAKEINQVVLQEDIRRGHCILNYVVEGELAEGGVKTLCEGSCIGHKRIQMFESVAVKTLRVRITDSAGKPRLTVLSAMNCGGVHVRT